MRRGIAWRSLLRRIRRRQKREVRHVDGRRALAISSHAERSQIGLREVEHADDPRREREHDVRLLRLAS